MRKFTCAFGLGLLLVAGSATPAFAQATSPGAGQPYPTCSKDVKQEEVDAARQKYIAGKVDYDEGRYESAIERFRDAYTKDCTKHDLLIIISRAYEQAQDRPEAIRALEEYLKRVPNSPERSTYEKRIQVLRDALEKEKAQKAAAANNGGAGGTGGGATAGGGGTTQPPSADKGGGHTVPPWILFGVGVAGMIAGGVVIATAPAFPDGCDKAKETCSPLPGETKDSQSFKDRQDKAGTAKNQPTIGIAILGAGAASAIGGLVWHFLEPTGSSSASTTPRLTPAVAPGYAGLSLGASF